MAMSAERGTLVPVQNLLEYFRDSVDAAMAENRVIVEKETAFYLVNLLTFFARSDAFFDAGDSRDGVKPLALMLADAVETVRPDARHFALQRLGDVALFIAGFFAERLHRAPVGLDYYCNMGGAAYRSLALQIRGTTRGRAMSPTFEELAAKFPELVDVVNEVKESARSARDEDILRLYDAWLKTGSRRAARLLRQAGVEPSAHARSAYEH
jgi:hypothetical protein